MHAEGLGTHTQVFDLPPSDASRSIVSNGSMNDYSSRAVLTTRYAVALQSPRFSEQRLLKPVEIAAFDLLTRVRRASPDSGHRLVHEFDGLSRRLRGR
jgi:hypothetical protein